MRQAAKECLPLAGEQLHHPAVHDCAEPDGGEPGAPRAQQEEVVALGEGGGDAAGDDHGEQDHHGPDAADAVGDDPAEDDAHQQSEEGHLLRPLLHVLSRANKVPLL